MRPSWVTGVRALGVVLLASALWRAWVSGFTKIGGLGIALMFVLASFQKPQWRMRG